MPDDRGRFRHHQQLVAGRPVRFVGERRLLAAYALAGSEHVETALEPEAADYRFARTLDAVLIGDFGGGTSDFSVMRFEPASARPATPLGHGGAGIAGDTFDRIVDQVVSPLLGKRSQYAPSGQALPIPPE